jgi:hypothetical protein
MELPELGRTAACGMSWWLRGSVGRGNPDTSASGHYCAEACKPASRLEALQKAPDTNGRYAEAASTLEFRALLLDARRPGRPLPHPRNGAVDPKLSAIVLSCATES